MTTDSMQNQSPKVGTSGAPTGPVAETAQPAATTSLVLKTAIEILAKKGWCQGDYVGRGGSVCALMALYAADPTPDNSIALGICERAQAFIVPLALPAWNDLYGTTLEDVVLLFKNLANLYEGEGR